MFLRVELPNERLLLQCRLYDQNNVSYFTLPSFYSFLFQICVLLVHTCLDLFLEVIAIPALSSGKASSEYRHLTRLEFLEVLCKLHAYCFLHANLLLMFFSCYKEKKVSLLGKSLEKDFQDIVAPEPFYKWHV